MENVLPNSTNTDLEMIAEWHAPINQQIVFEEKGIFDEVPFELVCNDDEWHQSNKDDKYVDKHREKISGIEFKCECTLEHK